jgi:hypothetical protein
LTIDKHQATLLELLEQLPDRFLRQFQVQFSPDSSGGGRPAAAC